MTGPGRGGLLTEKQLHDNKKFVLVIRFKLDKCDPMYKFCFAGGLLIVGGCGLLFWNEGRAVLTAVSLDG